MQTTSSDYQRILVSEGHWFETRLVIDGAGTFDETTIFSINSDLQMLQDAPKVGKAVAGEVEITMLMPSVEIPTMACLRPQTRVCNVGEQSEWLPQGVFFIDTRSFSKNGDGLDVLTIHGFDAMLKAEQDYASTSLTWDAVDTDIVAEIASKMGVSVDARTWTVMTGGYTLPLPTGYSLREYLGFIAASYIGSFIMTEEGKLRLVTLVELPPETNHLIDQAGDAITFGGVRILV